MKRNPVFVLFVVLLLSVAVAIPRVALGAAVDVSGGDWFRYGDFVSHYSSNDPREMFPPLGVTGLRAFNETEWKRTSVENVSLTTVFLELVTHLKDGTEDSVSGYLDVVFGIGNVHLAFFLVAANLSMGDVVYTTPVVHRYSGLKISQVVNRTYGSGVRETVYANWTLTMNVVRMNGEQLNGTSTEVVHWYWDRTTGTLVEYRSEMLVEVGPYLSTWSTAYRLVETNLWTVQEAYPWQTAIIILAAVAALIIVVPVYIYKRKTPTPQQPSRQTSAS